MSSLMYYDTPFSLEKSIFIINALAKELVNVHPTISMAISESKHDDLLNFEIDYADFDKPRDVFMSRQALAFFQKNTWIHPDTNTNDVALTGFLEAERSCLETNKRFRMKANNPKRLLDSALVFQVQRKISDILGLLPPLDELSYGFGPGANVGVSRLTSTRRKLSASPTCTASAWKHIDMLTEICPHWDSLSRAKPTKAGKLAFVPKNAKTDRTIVVEPVVNTFLQKGVGNLIRERLKRAGCDLNSQSRNQYGARKGSIDGSLCTIDLSAASDTISREVVAALLPYDWWSFLNDIRTEDIKMPDGEVIRLQKFSSMGNGFTFELESLIFFAICKVICAKGEFVSVYGDDIVVPTERYEELSNAITMFGFSVNQKKSFINGPFRESCGKDYFGGIDVRPCYVKEILSIKEMYRLHNFFIRQNEEDLANFCLQFIPKRFHHYGPDGFGDGHLLGDHCKHVFKKKRGYGGYCFRSFSAKPFKRYEPLPGDYAAFLLGTTSVPSCEGNQLFVVTSKGRMRPLDIESTLTSQSMYSERTSRPRYRLSRIYTLGIT